MPEFRIGGKTRACGVIGDPIEHSLSPAMHNAAYRKLGLDYVYLPFRVTRERLAEAIDGVRGLGIRGINVTIPHKVAVIPLLDSIDPLAEKIGAVNTIVNDDGRLTGFNTDASGFLTALMGAGVETKGSKVVVLGAGGAARAVCFALAEAGADLAILNRAEEMDWARDLAARISAAFKPASAVVLNGDNLAKAVGGADVLVNATSVGMGRDESLVPRSLLRPGIVVFDVVYSPRETRLLRDAKTVGARPVSGLEMLLWQGALAFEKFTGQKAPVTVMRRWLLAGLEAK